MPIETDLYNNLFDQLRLPSPITTIFYKELNRYILIKRDDLIHPIISGNKWRKIHKHIDAFRNLRKTMVLSMGGAYSNHLHALAFICFHLKIPCSLYVYGWNTMFNTLTLEDCKNWNAQLIPISRSEAAFLRFDSETYIKDRFCDSYWIPEGGGGKSGVEGIQNLVYEMPTGFDHSENLILCASGTGTTIQGLLQSTQEIQIATIQSVKMANYSWINNPRVILMETKNKITFGKISTQIIEFIDTFQKHYQILLDPIYTAPLLWMALECRITNNFKDVFFIHTGGLQGGRSHLI